MTLTAARRCLSIALIAVAGLAILAALPARASSWGVSPIRVELDRNARTGLLTITNDDTKRLGFQAKLMEWTQTTDGEDRYEESSELIVFPQMMTLEAGDRRAIRIGSRPGSPASERAYRLFIEELRDPSDAATQGGTQVAIVLRFAVPIFVAPPAGTANPEIVATSVSPGKVEIRIRNTGTRHVRFEQVVARIGEHVLGQGSAWYVFPGVTRTIAVPVDRAQCRTGTIEILATADGQTLSSKLEATPELCRP